MGEIKTFILRLLLLVFMVVMLFGVLFGITTMGNLDMYPKLGAGDLLLYYRLERSYSAGEVVVYDKKEKEYVGRIVAEEGDRVDITEDNVLMINDNAVAESGIFYTTSRYEDGVSLPLTLGEGEYFILGDYREGAEDSRVFGAVLAAEIRGVVITSVRRNDI